MHVTPGNNYEDTLRIVNTAILVFIELEVYFKIVRDLSIYITLNGNTVVDTLKHQELKFIKIYPNDNRHLIQI
jgi:hypothetical protein